MTIAPGEYTLTVNGNDLWYGVAGTGPVLVVQPPGWGIGSSLYQQTFRPLEREFTLVYPDPRGSGKSSTSTNPEALNVGSFVEDLEALRIQLGLDRFALLGHSHGGYIALNYALTYQQHLSHLVPLDAQLGVEEPGQDMERTLPARANNPRLLDAINAFSHPGQLASDRDLGAFLERVAPLYFHNPDGEGVAIFRNYVRTNRISIATGNAVDASDPHFLVRDKLHTIHVPTLVVVGQHDFICSPVQAQIIHQGVSASQFVICENSGHFPWIEEPEKFYSRVTAFLKDEASSA